MTTTRDLKQVEIENTRLLFQGELKGRDSPSQIEVEVKFLWCQHTGSPAKT